MANGILMSGQPMGALDANFISQARQSPIGEPEDPYRDLADAMRLQEAQATSEIDRIKNNKWGKFFNAIGGFGQAIQGRDPSQFFLSTQLAPWQEQQRRAQLGIAQTGLQRQQAEQEALRRMGGGVGNYNPRDYTADSWAAFVQGGLRDPSVLVRHDPFSQGGARYIPDGKGGFVPALSEEQITDTGRIQAEIDRLRAMQKEIGTRTGEVTTAEDVAGARGAIAAEEARSTTQAKGEEQRAQGIIQRGLEAAEASPTIRRSLELLDSVGTGGFERAAIAARQSLGIESANEAELSNNLATNVLGQLRSTFGAAFTEREGERLERIEAGIGKSTEGNRRLLEQALRMTERAAERAIKAAEARGDYETADEIRDAMAFTPQPQVEATKKGQKILRYNPQTGRLE